MTIDIKDIKQNHYTESGFKQFDPVIGDHTKNVCEALEKKGWDSGAIKKQLGKALEIMSFSNPSNAPRGQSTQGLVMGRVQSGKQPHSQWYLHLLLIMDIKLFSY